MKKIGMVLVLALLVSSLGACKQLQSSSSTSALSSSQDATVLVDASIANVSHREVTATSDVQTTVTVEH